MPTEDERLIVLSTDGHCGADLLDYKPYLETRYHDQFDAWADSYQDAWGTLDDADEEIRVGVSSYGADVNWLSDKRNRRLEREGIVGEVLFPNTSPPFFPTGAIGAYGPRDMAEFELRFAGIQAHNRWLVDFCAELPGRRAGIAQLFFNDIDRAVDEVRWAHAAGLKGILLPADHMLGLSNIYYPRFDKLWAACEELGMPVHRHGVIPNEAPSEAAGDAPGAIGMAEVQFLTNRPLTQLILAGVFDRFPGLRVVMTENRAAPVLPLIAQLDALVQYTNTEGTVGHLFGGKATRKLRKSPGEYLRSNVWHGSPFDSADIAVRHVVGVDRMMWGADYPHHEGTSPYSRQAYRINFAGLPEDEVRSMLSGTALEMYGFDAGAVRTAADRVGPTLREINALGALDEIPAKERMWCPTFADGAWEFADDAVTL